MKLDIGCGDKKRAGTHGVDRAAIPGVDTVHDLNAFPYPFADNSCDEIWMTDVLEHLNDTLGVMEEIHRILQPGGIVHVKVVHWSHHHAYADPTHVRFFGQEMWDFFTGKGRNYYTKAQFELVGKKFIYDTTVRMFVPPIPPLLNFLAYFLNNVLESVVVTLRKPA